MNKNSDLGEEIFTSPTQFRMVRLQVLNWGTFQNLHDIAISVKGFLFTGNSGSGKSTLLDAIATLLTQPGRTEFNAAAREGERGKKGDRSILSYIRGAYAEQTDQTSGEPVIQYLRKGTTRSVLALTFRNGKGKVVTLVQFLYIKGQSSQNSDVQKLFMIFEKDFEVKDLDGHELDNRRLKHAFEKEAHINDEFRPHSEKFRRMLGIENELALRLLHKTQSAKNLGELNPFLREFMLDEPKTFENAERLIDEFSELDQAHKSVVTVRKQIQVLGPAQVLFSERLDYQSERDKLVLVRDAAEVYTQMLKRDQLQALVQSLNLKAQQSRAVRETKEAQRVKILQQMDTIENLLRDLGGDVIERLKLQQHEHENAKTRKIEKLEQIKKAFIALDWELPGQPNGFMAAVGRAKDLLQEYVANGDEWRNKQNDLRDNAARLKGELIECSSELEALRRQPSNIPFKMLKLRKEIASAIGIPEDALPFAGELIEVKPEESQWRGAIERVLKGLALSVLVSDKNANALTNYVNDNYLGTMFVFNRTSQGGFSDASTAGLNSIYSKLNIKASSHSQWLESELKRNDHECVNSAQALRASTRPSITKEGLVKKNRGRYIKDDRSSVSERRSWILGFDNREKTVLFEQLEMELKNKFEIAERLLKEDIIREKKRSTDALSWNTVGNSHWNEIDIKTEIEALKSIEQQLKQLTQKSEFTQLATNLDQFKIERDKITQTIANFVAEEKKLVESRDKAEEDLTEIDANWGDIAIADAAKEELDRRFDEARTPNQSLDRLQRQVEKSFQPDLEALADFIIEAKQKIENTFANFKRDWPAESANMDDSLDSAQDYFNLLSRLKNEKLPDFEERFYELLRTQSNQNLAALSTNLTQARKTIMERMDVVNESLKRAPFGANTYLQISTTDRTLEEVKNFRQLVNEILFQAWTVDPVESERKFEILRQLVTRLASQEPVDIRWRELVLDVRQHVEFMGREFDSTHREVETYRSGAGKSGGQRQKLTTTCLAAALHYQLSRGDNNGPAYAAVVLDEAFDKADQDFTTISMNIFKKFGFQMIIATPMKSITTLQSFIGGACYIHIKGQTSSGHLQLNYNTEKQEIVLSEEMKRDAESALSS